VCATEIKPSDDANGATVLALSIVFEHVVYEAPPAPALILSDLYPFRNLRLPFPPSDLPLLI